MATGFQLRANSNAHLRALPTSDDSDYHDKLKQIVSDALGIKNKFLHEADDGLEVLSNSVKKGSDMSMQMDKLFENANNTLAQNFKEISTLKETKIHELQELFQTMNAKAAEELVKQNEAAHKAEESFAKQSEVAHKAEELFANTTSATKMALDKVTQDEAEMQEKLQLANTGVQEIGVLREKALAGVTENTNVIAAHRAEMEQNVEAIKNLLQCSTQEAQQVLYSIHNNLDETSRLSSNVQSIESNCQNVIQSAEQYLAAARQSAMNAAHYEQLAQQHAAQSHSNSGGGGGGIFNDLIDGASKIIPMVLPFL